MDEELEIYTMSTLMIGDVGFRVKDAEARTNINTLVDATYSNNQIIVSRLNDLNSRLETIETTTYFINCQSDWNESDSSSYAYIVNKPEFSFTNLDKIPSISTSASSNVTIEPYKLYNFGTVSTSMTISFDTTKEVSGYCAEYMFRFTAGNNCHITLPNIVKYNNGERPTTFTNSYIYEYSITDNLCVVGEFY